MRRTAFCLVVAATVAAGLVLPQASASASAAGTPSGTVLGTRVHVMPFGSTGSAFAHPATAPAGAQLTYYGGRVVSNIQTVGVLYGTGVYRSYVSNPASPSMTTFLPAVTASPLIDWLDGEYNTVTPSPIVGSTKTNQHIGRGTANGFLTITPQSAHNGSIIQDASIQAEIAAQINAGTLPAPHADAAGNNNTEYVMFFPAGKSICNGGQCSMVGGGFCAYHGTIANASGHGEVYYAVMPDFTPAGGGCGGDPVEFNDATSVLSHELVETITDPEVGLAQALAPPLAWYDNTNGEIGDICNAQQGSVVGSDGVTYVVQKQFSNAVHDCIVRKSGTTVTGVTSPPLLQHSPFAVTFSGPVKGVTTADLTLAEVGPTALKGSVSCLNASNATVSCVTGPVSTASITPGAALIAGEYYLVSVNPSSAGVVGFTDGVAVPATQTQVRAQTAFTAFQYPIKYTWAKVKNAAALGGSYAQEQYASATASFAATGASVGVVTWDAPDGGTATVTVTTPGQPTVTAAVDTYAAIAGDATSTIAGLPAGKHTVTVSVDGAHDGASTGTWVRIDGTVIGGVTASTPGLTTVWGSFPGVYTYTSSKGANVSFKFRGTGVVWTLLLGPNEGKAKVTIDGVTVAAAEDLYAAGFLYGQTFTFSGLSPTGFHTVVISTLGTKNPGSTGTVVTLQGFTAQ